MHSWPANVGTSAKLRNEAVLNAGADVHKRTIHLSSLLELVYEKGSELEPDKRKLKGRVVFLGNQVKDQYGATAVFEEMALSPKPPAGRTSMGVAPAT